MTVNNFMDQFYKFLLFICAVAVLNDPSLVGEWMAQMDIGYDLLWSEYLIDYTCNGENT